MAIAYVEHPVAKGEKAKYKKDFDKIIDIKFAPKKLEEGDKRFEKPKDKKQLTYFNNKPRYTRGFFI